MQGLNLFDRAVMSFVQQNCHNAFTDAVFPSVTYLGESGLVWIALAVLLLYFGRKSGWRTQGLLMLTAMLAGLLIGEIAMKNLVCRPRPFQEYPEYMLMLIVPPSGYSFPSGHSCSSFAAAVVVFSRDKRFGTAALALAALIAFSRVFLFVHYPTDVLAGAALGVACGLATVKLYPRARAALSKKKA